MDHIFCSRKRFFHKPTIALKAAGFLYSNFYIVMKGLVSHIHNKLFNDIWNGVKNIFEYATYAHKLISMAFIIILINQNLSTKHEGVYNFEEVIGEKVFSYILGST